MRFQKGFVEIWVGGKRSDEAESTRDRYSLQPKLCLCTPYNTVHTAAEDLQGTLQDGDRQVFPPF